MVLFRSEQMKDLYAFLLPTTPSLASSGTRRWAGSGPGLTPDRFLDFRPVSFRVGRVVIFTFASFCVRGTAMSEMSDWIQSNWFELGSLLVQCAILATLAWYGRKTLGILRASQLSNATADRPTAQEAAAPSGPEGVGHSVGEVAAAWRNLISWLQAPIASGGFAPWHRVIRWLQAPMGS